MHAATAPALTRPQRALLIALALYIPAGLATITALSPPDAHLVYGALALDALLFGGLLLAHLARRHGGLAALDISPRRIIRGLVIALALCGLAARLSGAPIGAALLAPLIAVEATIALLALRAIIRGYRQRHGPRWPRLEGALTPTLGARLARAAVTEFRFVDAALRSLTLRPLRRPDRGPDTYTTTHQSAWGAWVGALLMISVAEIALVHLLLAHAAAHPGTHALVFALHAYGLAWLLGDWRLMRETAHRLRPDALHLALGARWRATIPYARIEAVDPGEVDEPDRLIGEKRPKDHLAITPLDTPNLTITLTAPTPIEALYGFTRTARVLLLRVDDPAALAAALRARIG